MRKFLTLLIVLFAALSVASCYTTSGSGDILEPGQIDKSKSTKVTFYHAMGQANQEVI